MTAYAKPKIYYNNALRTAQEGHDGTKYAVCAEAVADPDNAKKVRGNISLTADVASLAALEGAGVVFDSTLNEYRITDSAAAMRRLEEVNFYTNDYFLGLRRLFVYGSYLYAIPGIGSTGAAGKYITVVKYSIADFEEVSRLTFEAWPDDPTYTGVATCMTQLSDGDASYLIIGGDTNVLGAGTGTLWRVNLTDFSFTDCMNFGQRTGCYDLAVIGTDVYSLGINSVSLNCELVKTVQGTTFVGVLDSTALAIGLLTGMAMVAYSSYLYIVFPEVATTKAIVHKVDPSGVAATVSLTLNAGELYPTGIVNIGTDVFVLCKSAANIAMLVQVATGAMTRTSALTLNAGELYPTAAIVYSSAVYVLCQSGTNTGILVKCANGTARTSALALDATDLSTNGSITALALSGSDIYAHVFSEATYYRGRILKCASGTARTAALDLLGGEQYATASLVYNNTLFVTCAGADGVAVLNGYALPDMERSSSLRLNAGELSPVDLVEFGGDIFVLCRTAADIWVLVRTLGGISRTSALTGAAGQVFPTAALVFGGSILITCRDSATNVGKVVATTGGTITASTLALNAGELYPTAMLTVGSDVYVACRDAGDLALLVKTAGGTSRTSVLAGTAGEEFPVALALIGTNVYIICKDGTDNTVVVKTTGAARTSAVTLAGFFPQHALVYNDHLIVLSRSASPGQTVIEKLSGGTVITNTLADTGEDAWQPTRLVLEGDVIYIVASNASYGNAGTIVSYDVLETFTLFSTLQDADIGGAFTVRAGLTCAQAAATRPVQLIADNTRAPRFTGTVNTETKIRIHAPNFIEDGGFESGGLTNWTAGANWAIDSTTELEGLYSAKWDGAANNNLSQARTGKLKAGKTYILLYKAQALTAPTLVDVVTVSLTAATSGTALDADLDGTSPIITSAAPLWISHEFVPDFDTDAWTVTFAPLLAKLDSATAVIIDEVYVYEKQTINSLVVFAHNWNSKGTIKVNAWRLSPLRSTSTANAALDKVEIGSFAVDSTDTINQALTASTYPVFEIVLPAVATWTPEAGEAYLGDYWTLPKYPKAMDPYATNDSKLREMSLAFTGLPPAYRKLNIEDIFTKTRADECVLITHNDELPILMEETTISKNAPYNPWTTDLTLTLVEKL